MNDNAKKVILIVVAVAAVIGAIFGAMSFMKGEQPEVVQTIQGSGGGEKEKAMQQQQQQTQSAMPAGERDLSGAMPGG